MAERWNITRDITLIARFWSMYSLFKIPQFPHTILQYDTWGNIIVLYNNTSTSLGTIHLVWLIIPTALAIFISFSRWVFHQLLLPGILFVLPFCLAWTKFGRDLVITFPVSLLVCSKMLKFWFNLLSFLYFYINYVHTWYKWSLRQTTCVSMRTMGLEVI